jgi:hypothetical protein
LVHIQDQLSKRRYLVDTGASFSIFPHQSSATPCSPLLTGPSGKRIPCWGEKEIELSFHGRLFRWTFLLAAVQFPILGVDFLHHFKLLVDPAANRLIAAGAISSPPSGGLIHQPSSACTAVVPGVKVPSGSLGTAPQAATCGHPPGIARLLLVFSAVVNAAHRLPAVAHDVLHYVETKGPPISAKFRRLDGEKLAAARAEFEILERDGIIRRSSSPWASPLHMVRKKDGGWRPCGDFRRLNLVTTPDSYPLPNMMDFAVKMAGCRFSVKLTSGRVTTRYPSTHLMFQRRRSPHRSGCSNT